MGSGGSSPFGVILLTASGKSRVILLMSSSRERPVCIERDVSVSSSIAASTSFGSIGWFGPVPTQELTFDPAPAPLKSIKDIAKRRPRDAFGNLIQIPPCGSFGLRSPAPRINVADFVAILVGQNAKHRDRQSSEICHLVPPPFKRRRA